MYVKSVNDTTDDYGKLLHEAANRDPKLNDTDCDTGRDTAPAEYTSSLTALTPSCSTN